MARRDIVVGAGARPKEKSWQRQHQLDHRSTRQGQTLTGSLDTDARWEG